MQQHLRIERRGEPRQVAQLILRLSGEWRLRRMSSLYWGNPAAGVPLICSLFVRRNYLEFLLTKLISFHQFLVTHELTEIAICCFPNSHVFGEICLHFFCLVGFDVIWKQWVDKYPVRWHLSSFEWIHNYQPLSNWWSPKPIYETWVLVSGFTYI